MTNVILQKQITCLSRVLSRVELFWHYGTASSINWRRVLYFPLCMQYMWLFNLFFVSNVSSHCSQGCFTFSPCIFVLWLFKPGWCVVVKSHKLQLYISVDLISISDTFLLSWILFTCCSKLVWFCQSQISPSRLSFSLILQKSSRPPVRTSSNLTIQEAEIQHASSNWLN